MDVKAVFVDAANTLLKPREPVGVTYAREARRHGLDADPVVVEQRFRVAMRSRHGEPQVGDGRAYWSRVVAESVAVDLPALNEALYLRREPPMRHPERSARVEVLHQLGIVQRQPMAVRAIPRFRADHRLAVS